MWPPSLSLAMRVSTSGRIDPAFLVGGSSTETISILGEVSIPRSFDVTFLMGFFLAFMIFGRVAYRGSFNRKSALKTAGVFILMTSSPPSISRVIFNCPWSGSI